MVHKVTAALVLDPRNTKQDGRNPIKLRVTYERRRKYYAIGFDATPGEWEIINSDKAKGKLRTIRSSTEVILRKAEELLQLMEDFTFHKFEEIFFDQNQGVKSKDVFAAYDIYIKELENEGRIGNQFSYSASKKSLKAYKDKLQFEEITPEFLKSYESWMSNNKRSLTTVGYYLRALRTITNKAIEEGILNREDYPFGKYKYIIPGGKKGKTALDLEDVSKIYHYKTIQMSFEDRSKDFWMFSYMCNGMNFKDICYLKYNQIKEDRIIFIREKTKRTNKENPVLIEVALNEPINQIIAKWGNSDRSPNNLVFPIINVDMSLLTQKKVIMQFIKTTNKWINRIAKHVGITKKITTYVARHTFSYIMLNNGASIELVSNSLGHSDIKTTQNYASSGFNIDIKKKFSEILTNF